MLGVAEVRAAVVSLRALVARLEPGGLNGRDAAALVEAFDEIERLGAAARALAARRVEETNQ